MSERDEENAALAATLQGMDFSTFGCGNPWKHRAAQLLRSDWLKQRDERLQTEAVLRYIENAQPHVIAQAISEAKHG